MRPAIYIPNFNGSQQLERTLRSLRTQTRQVDVVVVDNGSTDGSATLVREKFPETFFLELGENLGFGRAINRAVREHPSDPLILLNNDVECEPQFVAAMMAAVEEGADMVAGVLLQEAAPTLIDSAGVVADRTLMGFDYLHGEPAESARTAPPPLGPTGGAALYSRAAFESVGGFDDRIFLYYEDLDLALRLRSVGATCRLASDARAVHAYSATLGPNSGAKWAQTGWSRGYMLRRYRVMSKPRYAVRVVATEGAICAGQLLLHRSGRGLKGRIDGWRSADSLPRKYVDPTFLLDIRWRSALTLRRQRRAT